MIHTEGNTLRLKTVQAKQAFQRGSFNEFRYLFSVEGGRIEKSVPLLYLRLLFTVFNSLH
jgi:hypothetical protein